MKLAKPHLLVLSALVLTAIVYLSPNAAAEKAVLIPPVSASALQGLPVSAQPTESAVFAGGCFWGIQAVFQHTKGVLGAVSGYAGGEQKDADYETVSGGRTGHAESVEVTYDPRQVTYAQLLQIYFSVAHDPTQLDRQYPDVGTQYRSALFYKNGAQQQLAQRYIAQLDTAKVYPSKIVTQVTPLKVFYAAEKYHQNYATLNPGSGYIAHYDLPKIANLQTTMPQLYRADPVLVKQ